MITNHSISFIFIIARGEECFLWCPACDYRSVFFKSTLLLHWSLSSCYLLFWRLFYPFTHSLTHSLIRCWRCCWMDGCLVALFPFWSRNQRFVGSNLLRWLLPRVVPRNSTTRKYHSWHWPPIRYVQLGHAIDQPRMQIDDTNRTKIPPWGWWSCLITTTK